MGAPHNINRYGETWDQDKINAYQEVLDKLKPYDAIILSGGWAWHFLSPKSHPEFKHAHDHKDLDLFALPPYAGFVVELLKIQGFEKINTKYDRLPSSEDFRRYEKVVSRRGKDFRVTIDFFVKELPWVKIPSGWVVVEPRTLLSMYGNIHSSDKAWCVQTAAGVLEDPKATLDDLIHSLEILYETVEKLPKVDKDKTLTKSIQALRRKNKIIL